MDIEKICELGRTVIDTEARMIHSLTSRIDHHFAKACQLLHHCQGRIVVMGVGKSGHVSKKIAATFASTGSPAFFIHPNEAMHGDIGMITPFDVILALSNSGESTELLAILPSIRRLGTPLITLTGKPNSALAKAATINIDVSIEEEACPLGLAPTSSTTAALVMGDALAMTLLNKRGFTKNDFALSHPGGALGRRLLLRVGEIMHQQIDVPVVSHTDPIKAALVEMTQKKLGMTTVVNGNGELIGVFTDGDVRRTLDLDIDIQKTPVCQVMSTHPKTILPSLLAAEALTLMETHKITALIVADNQKKPVGIIHIHDILRAGVI